MNSARKQTRCNSPSFVGFQKTNTPIHKTCIIHINCQMRHWLIKQSWKQFDYLCPISVYRVGSSFVILYDLLLQLSFLLNVDLIHTHTATYDYRIKSTCILELNSLHYVRITLKEITCLFENLSSKLLKGFQLCLIFGVCSQSCRDWKFINSVRLRIGQTVRIFLTRQLDQNCP